MNHSITASLIVFLIGLSSGNLLAAESAEIVVTKNRMVPMRDGVKLATDIYRPAEDGEAVADPLPVILIRTPYDKDGKQADGTFFARHGYVFAAQDVRGRYKSESAFYIYTNEGPDGYDTVEWIAGQPWCNGKVGTWGSSYQAATQNALAVLKPPHLRTMFVVNGTSNYVEDGGKVYEVTIDLWATANLFRKGHRIRLDVSSSNFPMFDVNPNTGEQLGRHTHMKKALNSVFHDAEHPSCLILPVRAGR